MIIRKLYRIETAHIVINAISQRCSRSIHGHSSIVEVFLSANHLDNAGMIYDFGAFKKTIGSFVDMFDHSVHIYGSQDAKRLDFFKETNERYVVLPCNPTAENYCVLFRDCIGDILRYSDFTNGEGSIVCTGVRYHETSTGYAESTPSDLRRFTIADLEFSPKTLEEASDEIKAIISNVKKRWQK